MIPVMIKPNIHYKYPDFVTEIPNALNIQQINKLIEYAHGTTSGFHRRGSKDPNTRAKFFTCQVHPLDDEIYGILGPLWEPYTNLTFIEPYEIKEYREGDLFEYHTDTYINLYKNLDRKMNMIVQLSDPNDYSGGDLYISHNVCSREQGTAIIFPACIYHCITPITKGVRHSLIGHGWGNYNA